MRLFRDESYDLPNWRKDVCVYLFNFCVECLWTEHCIIAIFRSSGCAEQSCFTTREKVSIQFKLFVPKQWGVIC